jgi:antitoxin ParD1/3/4
MARNTSVSLSDHFTKFIDEQVESGRYGSASEVIREGLRRIEAEERQLAWLREQLAIGLADIRAGNVHEVNDAFWEELDREVDEAVMRDDKPSPHVCP